MSGGRGTVSAVPAAGGVSSAKVCNERSLVLALLPGVGTTFHLRSMLAYSGSDFDVKCLGEPRMYAFECDKFWLVIVSYGVAKLPRR